MHTHIHTYTHTYIHTYPLGTGHPAGLPFSPRSLLSVSEVAILPLGTGNDLARELGWGGGGRRGAHTQLVQLLTDVERAQVTLLDRWSVRFGDARIGRRTNSDPPARTLQNYMGIGVDAKARTSRLLIAYDLLATCLLIAYSLLTTCLLIAY